VPCISFGFAHPPSLILFTGNVVLVTAAVGDELICTFVYVCCRHIASLTYVKDDGPEILDASEAFK
jgi:hypothetical protein